MLLDPIFLKKPKILELDVLHGTLGDALRLLSFLHFLNFYSLIFYIYASQTTKRIISIFI